MNCTRCAGDLLLLDTKNGECDTIERNYTCKNCGLGVLTIEAHSASINKTILRKKSLAIDARIARWDRNLKAATIFLKLGSVKRVSDMMKDRYDNVHRWIGAGQKQAKRIAEIREKFD